MVAAADFLRPASVRLEYGREDPDEFLDGWLDEAGLRREVLDPAGPDGTGRVLPRLWDAAADRAYRDGYTSCPPTGSPCWPARCCWAAGCRWSWPCTCG